jgi:hypothetical protein
MFQIKACSKKSVENKRANLYFLLLIKRLTGKKLSERKWVFKMYYKKKQHSLINVSGRALTSTDLFDQIEMQNRLRRIYLQQVH